MYIRLSDNFYPLSEQEIRAAFPNTSFATPFNPDGYAVVFPTPQPVYDQYSQKCIEQPPVLSVKGTWEQVWQVVDLTGEELAAGLTMKAEDEARSEAARINSIWQAARDYEYAEISGSAVGLLTMGVMQGKPKCIAVQNWIHGIWAEYYTRKAGTSTDTDYSVCGTIPHTVPELMEELGL